MHCFIPSVLQKIYISFSKGRRGRQRRKRKARRNKKKGRQGEELWEEKEKEVSNTVSENDITIRALEITFYNCVTFFIKGKNIPWRNIKEFTFNCAFFYNKITHFYIRLSLLLSTQLSKYQVNCYVYESKLYPDLILALIPILLYLTQIC